MAQEIVIDEAGCRIAVVQLAYQPSSLNRKKTPLKDPSKGSKNASLKGIPKAMLEGTLTGILEGLSYGFPSGFPSGFWFGEETQWALAFGLMCKRGNFLK